MNGRQVSLAGHRFRAVVDPRIAAWTAATLPPATSPDPRKAEQDLWTRYVRDGDATRSKATARVVPLGSQPTPARLADGLVRLLASPTGHSILWQPSPRGVDAPRGVGL
jgi:hypothetical protein